MNRNGYFRSLLLAAGLLVVAAALFIWNSADPVSRERPLPASAGLTIALPATPPPGLLFIARAKGFFRDAGLEVSLLKQSSGKAALQAVIDGRADLGATSEVPLVHAWLDGRDIPVSATIFAAAENNQIVARRDHGIATLADLKGKRVGLTRGTNAEFLLDALLTVNEMSLADLEVVHLKPPQTVDALVSGAVDAVSTWNPHVIRVQQALGDNQVSFSAGDIYTSTFNLVSRRRLVTERPLAIERVLRALARAADFVRQQPAAARDILAGGIGMDATLLAELWPVFEYRLSLDQSLVATMESEAQWMIRTGLTPAKQVPNFFRAVHADGLQQVAPENITVSQ